jgi:hypothetical protein
MRATSGTRQHGQRAVSSKSTESTRQRSPLRADEERS